MMDCLVHLCGASNGVDPAAVLDLQWNPRSNVWAAPYWGHVVSTDLVRWKRLPVALVPDAPYDIDGCFSGSASIGPDGKPILLYTGVYTLIALCGAEVNVQ